MGGALDASEPLELFDPVDPSAGDLDSDLDAVFATASPFAAQEGMPDEGPPKDESEEDFVVALLED